MRGGQIAVVYLCEAKVRQFDYHIRSVIFKEQVFRFYVTMSDTVVVAVLQCLGNLPRIKALLSSRLSCRTGLSR